MGNIIFNSLFGLVIVCVVIGLPMAIQHWRHLDRRIREKDY